MKKLLFYSVAVILLLSAAGCGYNTIQANEEAVKAAWGDVESSYQRRSDLIPNLVEVVKGYAKHESETLQAVTEARAKVGSMQVVDQKLDGLAAAYGDGNVYRMDGVSVEYPDWHFNVRGSNTEPLLRLNLEGQTPELMETKRDEVLGYIRS